MAGSTIRTGKGTKSADSMSLDASMGYLIRRTFRGLTEVLEDKLADHKLSSSMWYFLRLLWESDGLTQKELSAQLGLTQPTTVAAMDNLERRGLIKRKRNVTDRRKINIHLTPAGVALKKEIQPFAREVNELALRDLSDAEVETLRRMLWSINGAVERYWTEKGR